MEETSPNPNPNPNSSPGPQPSPPPTTVWVQADGSASANGYVYSTLVAVHLVATAAYYITTTRSLQFLSRPEYYVHPHRGQQRHDARYAVCA